MRYEIEEVKGQRVVRRRKAETRSESVAPKTIEEPKVQRVVKRKIPAAPPIVAVVEPKVKAKASKKKKAAPAPKKPRKAKAKAPVPVPVKKVAYPSGQNGPEIDLDVVDLNDKERRVVDTLNGAGRGERVELTIGELGAAAFAKQTAAQGMSWVRNSLRRLVRAGYVEKCKRGSYRVTDTGRRRLSKAA